MAVISQAKLPSDKHHWTLVMISQHWFRFITWTNVDLVPCRHIVSLGHNELTCHVGYWFSNQQCTNMKHLLVVVVPGSILGLLPNQWETALLCNDVSHWLGASLEPLYHCPPHWLHHDSPYTFFNRGTVPNIDVSPANCSNFTKLFVYHYYPLVQWKCATVIISVKSIMLNISIQMLIFDVVFRQFLKTFFIQNWPYMSVKHMTVIS